MRYIGCHLATLPVQEAGAVRLASHCGGQRASGTAYLYPGCRGGDSSNTEYVGLARGGVRDVISCLFPLSYIPAWALPGHQTDFWRYLLRKVSLVTDFSLASIQQLSTGHRCKQLNWHFSICNSVWGYSSAVQNQSVWLESELDYDGGGRWRHSVWLPRNDFFFHPFQAGFSFYLLWKGISFQNAQHMFSENYK